MFNIKTALLYLIIIFIIPLKGWCQKIETSKRDTNIVIIFGHIPACPRTLYPFPKMTQRDDRPQVTIFDNFYQYDFNLAPLKSDTIILAPQSDLIVLRFLYSMNLAPIDYVINKGDTITFSFVNNLPYAGSKIADRNKSLNYEYEQLIAHKNNLQPTPYDIYKQPVIVAKDVNDAMNNYHAVQRDYYDQSRSFLKKKLSALDSSKNIFNKYLGIFNFFQDKYTYEIAELDFEQNKLSEDSLHKIFDANKNAPTNQSYSYFFPFIEKVAEKVIVNHAKVVKYDNGPDVDYRDVYDQVRKWLDINDFYRKHLLYTYLKKIGSLFSTLDLQKYVSDFATLTHDSILVNKIHDEFPSANYYSSSAKDSLYLLDENNNRTSFQTFLASCKGKVVYIDFWASWCVPCREEMKNAAKLRKAFENKSIVFAYFSVDKNKNEWLQASTAEKLNVVQHNYILMNVDASGFLKSINFGAIPRHLVYDKPGNLVYKNATGPGSSEIQRLITYYLVH